MFKHIKTTLAAATLIGLTTSAFADGSGSPLLSDRYPHLERHSQARTVEGRSVVNSTVPQTAQNPAELTTGGF